MKRKNQYLDHLPISVLKLDRGYQRDVSEAKVRKLIGDWQERAVGVLHVSARDDGYYVIDGQHRVRAAQDQGLSDFKVPCHVHRDLSREEEAAMFLYLNDSKNVSAYDRFKAGLIAGDEDCIGVQQTLKHYGLEVGPGSSDGTIRCVTKLLTLYRKDPQLLDRLCLIATEAWGTRQSAFEQVVVTGLGTVLGRYNGELDEAAFVKKLSGYRGGPTALAGDARGYADVRPISVGRAAAEIMVDAYNRGRRSRQLPAL